MIVNFELKITANDLLTNKVYRTRFTCIQPLQTQIAAGQYLSIRVAEKARRSYSLSSAPGEVSEFETFVDISPQGPGSIFFQNLKPGDKFTAIGPMGKFIFVERADNRPAVFLATGTGVTPFLAMFREQLQQNKITRPIYLYWGLRYREDIFLAEELAELKRDFPNFNSQIVLSREAGEWDGEKGYCTEILARDWDKIANIDVADFYLCGGSDMLAAARTQLAEKGISTESVFFEKFY